MTLFLLIDTATEKGVVACGGDDQILFSYDLPSGFNQSKDLMPKIVEATERLLPSWPLTAIAVGAGPGSYTGIRVGVAVAQALAFAWDLPLVAVSSLDIFSPSSASLSFAVVFDARMGGIYFQAVEKLASGGWKRGVSEVVPVEQIKDKIGSFAHIVTPHKDQVLAKLVQFCPGWQGEVEERAPSASSFLVAAQSGALQRKSVYPPAPVDIFYLRQTAAERERQSALERVK